MHVSRVVIEKKRFLTVNISIKLLPIWRTNILVSKQQDMLDKLAALRINAISKWVSLVSKIYPSEKLYQKKYKYIEKQILEELNSADAKITNAANEFMLDNSFIDTAYVMWWQGYEKAPYLVKQNIDRMSKIWKNIVILTADNYRDYCNISSHIIDKFNQGKITITLLSDIVRANVLREHGGIWIDSTVMVTPIFKKQLEQFRNKEFFTLSRMTINYQQVAGGKWVMWFWGAPKNYPLFEFLSEFYNVYFMKHDLSIEYFIADYATYYYWNKHPNFKMYLLSISKDWNPYFLQNYFDVPYDEQTVEKCFDDPKLSVQKLTYKHALKEGSILSKLSGFK